MYSAAYTWAKVLGHLEHMLGDVLVQTWFDDAEAIALTEEQLIIYSPSDFRQEAIEKNFMAHIRDALRQHHISAEPVLWGEAEYKAHRDRKKLRPSFTFHPQFTFSNYIAGSSNQLALKIATAAAQSPGQDVYNPLFFYGPPGVGKTHLLYAIANEICANAPDCNIIYVKGEQFTYELIDAIRDRTTAAFRSKYRAADVLLVDDIQFISGKEATQEEFFHTFNELYEQHRQIVMTADRRPADMVTLEDRLKSRFGEGIMVGIVPPDKETRLLILRSKAALLGLTLSDEIYELLASQLTDNVRQIEGALKKIRAFRDLDGMKLTPDNIARATEDLCSETPAPTITADRIIETVCRYYNVERDKLMSQQRSKNIAEPRQVAMYLTRKLAKLTLPEAGRIFARHHGTVHHDIQKTEALLRAKDPHICRTIEELTTQLQA